MQPLKLAVIGVGALGRHHARILSSLPDVELVAVADSNAQQGQQIAESVGARWVSDHRTLIDEVDAVTIAVPTAFHHRVATDFLENGIPTLVEKPLSADLSEAVSLVKSAERTGAILQVGHIERFNPAFRAAERLCDEPKYIRAERFSPFSFRSTDIGVIHDMMIHDIDLVLSLVNSPVAHVEAFGIKLMGEHEDSVQARLTFENGCVADLSASRIHPTSRRATTIWTKSRCINVDYSSREVTSYSPSARLLYGMSPVERARQPGADIERLKQEVFGSLIEVHQETASAQDALTAELQEFVDCVRHGATPTVTGTVAIQALTVAERLLGIVQATAALEVPTTFKQARAA
ncbi:MAG: Gfo/Idh/MocA family oxidoreductase [Planctomycetia bacterium]|nr:Gfo/Idh/MocA family oxidoreductase [Planctomycetia bacterium]